MSYQPKSYRKFLATTLSAAVVTTGFAGVGPIAASAATNFSDVSEQRESYEAIQALVDLGVITGYPDGTFKPRAELTRQQAAVMFARAFDLDTNNVTNPGFSDIPTTHRYYNEIAAAVEAGFFNAGGTFNAGGNFTRAQAATVITRAWGLEGTAQYTFSDNAGSHANAVALMASEGLINGYSDGTFRPNNALNRENFAQLMHRTIEKHGLDRTPSEPAPDVPAVFNLNASVNSDKTAVISGRANVVEEVQVTVLNSSDEAVVEETVSVDNRSFELVTEVLSNGNYRVVVEAEGVETQETSFSVSDVTAAPGSVTAVNQPTAGNLAIGSPMNEVFKFSVTAGSDDITLRSTQLRQLGTAHNRDHIDEVHLLDENGNVVASGTINADNQVRLSRSVRIPANTTREFTVAVDLNNDSTAATATVQFGIESVNAFSANAQLNGSFPLVGNSFSMIQSNIGQLNVRGSSIVVNADVGDTQEELGQFTVQPSQEGVTLEQVLLNAHGGIDPTDFENLTLYRNNGADAIDVDAIVSSDDVSFDLRGKDIRIARSNAETFVLKGDPIDTQSEGYFEIEETYDVRAKGINSGYNVRIGLEKANVDGRSTVALSAPFEIGSGDSRLTISTNSPQQGSTIVATSSSEGVVREYNLVAPGEDITVTDASAIINTRGQSVGDLVSAVELYDPERNVVLASETISRSESGDEVEVSFDNVNWFVDRGTSNRVQLRIRSAGNETLDNAEIDVRLNSVEYDLEDTRTRGQSMLSSVLPSSPQYKKLTAGGSWNFTQLPSGNRIFGYSVSDTLRQAPIGGFRVEALDENLRVDDIIVSAAPDSDLLDSEAFGGRLDNLIAAPNLYVAGEDTPVATGSFINNGTKIEFEFNNNYVVETGLENRKQFVIKADILSADVPEADLNDTFKLQVENIDSRGQNSNIRVNVPESQRFTNTVAGDLGGFNYRPTSVTANLISTEDRVASNTANQRMFTFSLENMATVRDADKSVFVKQVPMVNQFDWNSDVTTDDVAQFAIRDDKNERLNPVGASSSTFRAHTTNLANDSFVFKALNGNAGNYTDADGYLHVTSGSSGRTETEEFTVVGNFSYARGTGDDRVAPFDGSTIRFDFDRSNATNFEIKYGPNTANLSDVTITPYIRGYQGPEISVPIR